MYTEFMDVREALIEKVADLLARLKKKPRRMGPMREPQSEDVSAQRYTQDMIDVQNDGSMVR